MDKAGAQHELVRRNLGIGRDLSCRGNKRFGPVSDHSLNVWHLIDVAVADQICGGQRLWFDVRMPPMFVRVMTIFAMLVFIGAMSGCFHSHPIHGGTVRTPYDRYALKRGQQRPSDLIGATSGKMQQQQLRQRLTPLDP